MRIATIQEDGGGVYFSFPSNPEATAVIQTAVGASSRQWDVKRKVWIIAESAIPAAIEAISPFFDKVIDGRGADVDLDGEPLTAEMETARENQAFITAHETAINAEIERLDAVVASYSYKSLSSKKAEAGRRAALLRYALVSARQPVTSLTEIAVAGLAAAAKLVEKFY